MIIMGHILECCKKALAVTINTIHIGTTGTNAN